MFLLISSGWREMSNPATLPAPAVGGKMPQSILMVVDLPAPFGPRKPKISPRLTFRLTLFTAMKSPKRFSRLLRVTAYSASGSFMAVTVFLAAKDRHEDIL